MVDTIHKGLLNCNLALIRQHRIVNFTAEAHNLLLMLEGWGPLPWKQKRSRA